MILKWFQYHIWSFRFGPNTCIF